MQESLIPKIRPQISNEIAETLFITLYMRSQETKNPDGIIRDTTAEKLVSKIDYDFSKFSKGKMSGIGTSIRVRHFDTKVSDFIEKHRQPVVVLIGCGLDTRYQRLSNSKKAVFYELDLPEVIKLRQTLLPPKSNQKYISASMLETDWMEMLAASHPQGNFIFVIEGVLMYFRKNQVKSVICNLARHFPGSEIHFDAVSEWTCKHSKLHDTIKHMNADFIWGLNDASEIECWDQNIRHHDTLYYMDVEKKRWGLKGYIMGLIPTFRKASCILHYDVVS
ncbi:class I SAM-dependent methyltransferase [uncultured Methanolobus sp.]|uniref:class I SAM-dependent methyltransferase n=1 Tax=uncultured Methanolobus sp. TaxID=218300 RepID=UPI002AAACEBB|nr:class I SAM-dependent methyltransferase [uncultured Methanolobus sp.]